MQVTDLLAAGRAAYDERAWANAYAELRAADEQHSLDVDDLLRLATAAYLIGQDREAGRQFARAFTQAVDAGRRYDAVRAAFWAGFTLFNTGQGAQAHGWSERARRLLTEADTIDQTATEATGIDHREFCYLDLLDGMLALGSPAATPQRFAATAASARHHGEADVAAVATMAEGTCLVESGASAPGMSRLDEAMLAVTSGEVGAMAAGLIYCAAVDACHVTFDVRRSLEWTAALSRWCDAQPDLVPYRGQCLVHRVQLMQLRGSWDDALQEVDRACTWLSDPPHPAVGAALYERAELHRLQGRPEEAESLYAEAARWGQETQPGLALLRLAQGQRDAAAAGLRRALTEPLQSTLRPMVLAAQVEVLLANGDIEAAREPVRELHIAAVDLDVPMVGAIAANAAAQLALAEADATASLRNARRAWSLWHEVGAPYQAARSRVVVGCACRALGDDDAAGMEFEAARAVFAELQATPDLGTLDRLCSPGPDQIPDDPLTAREREVLRLVAAGLTNRAIAAELFLSEKTVARHVSNIFTKLDVSSRTAAAAYAFEHGLS